MKILLFINSEPEIYMEVTKKTTVLSIKEFLKKYNPEKIQLFVDDKTESKIFNTDKYDNYDLTSIWKKMTNPAIKITVKNVSNLPIDIKAKFTIDAPFFKYLLTTFGNFQYLMGLFLEGNYIKVFDLDTSHVSLMSAKIPLDIEYEKERKIDYGILPIEMKKFLGTNIKNKEVTFLGKSDNFNLKIGNEEKEWINAYYDEEFLSIPIIDFVSEVTLSSKDIYKLFMLKKKQKQKSVWLEVKNGKFYIDDEKFEHIELKSSKNIKKLLSTNLLQQLSRTENSQYAPEVTLYFSEDAPMKMTYLLSMKSKVTKKKIYAGDISYYVAPQIPEDEFD